MAKTTINNVTVCSSRQTCEGGELVTLYFEGGDREWSRLQAGKVAEESFGGLMKVEGESVKVELFYGNNLVRFIDEEGLLGYVRGAVMELNALDCEG